MQVANSIIRKYRECDLDDVLRIWLKGNLEAHPFISSSYWKRYLGMMPTALSQANVVVYEIKDKVVVFAGMSGCYIEGLFVMKEYQGRGIGHSIMSHLKSNNSNICLRVYEKNLKAINFYSSEEFKVIEHTLDEETTEKEFIMCWQSQL